MFKTFAKFNADKGRTICINVNGATRFITNDTRAEILNWRGAGSARYEMPSGSFRDFWLYQSPKFDYVLQITDDASETLQVVASPLSLLDRTAAYRNNPSWSESF